MYILVKLWKNGNRLIKMVPKWPPEKEFKFRYADDKVTLVKCEDALQMAVNEVNKINKKYGINISSSKIKNRVMWWKHTKVQIRQYYRTSTNFNYLGNITLNRKRILT